MLITLLLVISLSTTVMADPELDIHRVATVLKNGPASQKIDLVFLGDGYTTSDGALFEQHVQLVLERLWAVSPFGDRRDFFNAHLVEVRASKHKNPYPFGSRLVPGRDFVVLDRSDQVARAAQRAPARDIVIVISRVKGRAHARRSFILLTENGLYAAAHEMGHALAGLGDEYESGSRLLDRRPLPTRGDLDYANLTLDKFIDPSNQKTIEKTAKWGHFLRLPGAFPLVSAYQGGASHSVGVWRPSFRCTMRDTQLDTFCPVCHEEVAKSLFKACGKTFDHERYHRTYPLQGWQ